MNINIKLKTFEGPFDLLYHLIEKNKINIYDIPIAELTNQYLEYIQKINITDLDLMSEFLVMASTLIEIKSKMLLPKPKDTETIEQDPRDEIVNKLIQYKNFKSIAKKFSIIENEQFKIFFRKSNLFETKNKRLESNVDDSLKGIQPIDIFIAFENVLRLNQKRTDKIRSKFNSVKKDLYTIEDKSEYILNLLKTKSEIEFEKIFRDNANRMEIIVTFLALLELIKVNKVLVYQNDLFGDIILNKR